MAKKPKASTTAVPLKLQGKSVFLGGNFYHRDEPLRTLIKLEGGKIVAELTDKTDLLVLGYSGAANPQKKAVKLNAQGAAIQVVAMIPFEQQIKPTPDEAAQLLLSGRDGIERWNCHLEMTPPHQAGFAFGPQRSGVPPYIRGADFSSADLSSAQLGELADHCDFTGANLKGCSLVLSNCQLEGANLDDVLVLKLIDCSAQKVDFSKVAAEHAYFDGSNFSGARFGGKRRRYYYFVKCQLDDADLSGLEAPTSGFKFCSLRNARLAALISARPI
jgi:hypothetical protein